MKNILICGLLLISAASLVMAGTTITIKGSDTLVRLGQRWAEEYMKKNPGVVIGVSGGGSGTGIAALLNGATDICEASRDMKEKEYKLAEQKGIKPYRISVALDGISVFLHEANPVKELSFAQLKGMYTGAITNWKEVGGSDARVILYGRENNSGTYAFFKKQVLLFRVHTDPSGNCCGGQCRVQRQERSWLWRYCLGNRSQVRRSTKG
jgi:phosphate transport system substrate-binding protein